MGPKHDLKRLKKKREVDYMEMYFQNSFSYEQPHCYYLYSSGTGMSPKCYETRHEAEIAMYEFCSRNNISVECTECDKHERKYSNHNGIRFYINRI